MSDSHSFLVDWSIRFLENKDIIRKEIQSIEKNKQDFDFIITYKDTVRYFWVMIHFDDSKLSNVKKQQDITLFILNNKKNVDAMLKKWNDLKTMPLLRLFFINPFSTPDRSWALQPNIHDRICDPACLKTGLQSMSELVLPLTESDLNSKLQ